jgi:hypothetical protein
MLAEDDQPAPELEAQALAAAAPAEPPGAPAARRAQRRSVQRRTSLARPARPLQRERRPVARTADELLPLPEALALGQLVQGQLEGPGDRPTLVVFFSIASVQSQRLLDYAKVWHEKYGPLGLSLVGVHSPELERTRSDSALRLALRRWAVPFPVVQDPDRQVWQSLGNMGWDSCHLYVPGAERARHVHPSGTPVRQIELDLQRVLDSSVRPGRLLEPLYPEDAPGAVRLQPSPDVQLGYRLGEIANLEGFLPHQTIDYRPSAPAGTKPMLRGGWESSAECLVSQPLPDSSSVLEVRCNAREVYVLAEARSPVSLAVYEGQVPLDPAKRTKDWSHGADGAVTVHELRLYQLIGGEHLENRQLRLVTQDTGLQLYLLRFTTEAVHGSQ